MKCKYYLQPIETIEGIHFEEVARDVLVSLNEHELHKDRVEVYTIQDSHGYADIGYLKTCKEITLEQYNEITKGWYTPKEYLKCF